MAFETPLKLIKGRMAASPAVLAVRLFGPLVIERDGHSLPLPASRKTRAILGFLALSSRPVSRPRLCEMFFDLPDDPRAALRWSLSKLRPLLDSDDRARLISERDAVRIDWTGAEIDALTVQRLAAAIDPQEGDPTACLALLDMMDGELLEDCELPDRPEYSAWLEAQRQDFRMIALRLARQLAGATDGEERISHLRRLLRLDPADEDAVAALVATLAQAGRRAEAEELVASAQRQRRSLGLPEDPGLRRLLRGAAGNPDHGNKQAPSADRTAAPAMAKAPGYRRPSIAILPLIDHSRGTIPADLVAPFAETVAHMLARFREIRVCAPAAVEPYANAIADPAEIAAGLGVSHLLTGSVLVREGMIKARASIIEAEGGDVLLSWETQHRADDPQAMIDDLPARLAVQAARSLTKVARARAIATPEDQRSAWDHFHAGVVLGLAATPADYQQALACFERAIALDDRFARAIGAAAWAKACLGYREQEDKRQEALMQAHRAIALGSDDAEALSVGAWAAVHVGLDFDAGLRATGQAVRANPLSRVAWSTSGWVRAMAGEHETPLAHFDRAEQCDPDDAHLDNVDGGRAFCHWLAGRYDAAMLFAERALQQLPGHVGGHVVAMAAAIASGDDAQARSAAQRFLKVFPLGPAAPAIQSIPIRDPARKDMLVAAVERACRFAGQSDPLAPPEPEATASRARKGGAPLIAVLPFTDQSMEPLPGHVLDGFFEGLVHAMSRFRSIDVVAGASTAALRGQIADPVQVARSLGADLLVAGSIACSPTGRLRLRWRALDGHSGQPLALGDLEGALDDVWDLQETAATAIAVEVEPRAQAEAHRVRCERPTASPAAYDLYLQGLFAGFSLQSRDYAAALRLFQEAIALDPNFHPALAMAPWAAAYANAITGPQELRHYAEMSRTALALGINDARTQATAGTALFYMAKDFAAARGAIDRAITLNPNEYTAWICGGWMHAMKGEASEAHRMFDRSTRLNPLAYGANGLLSGRAMADFMIGQISSAEEHIRVALSTDDGHPSALMTGIATAAALGREADLQIRRARFLAIYPRGLGDFIIQSLPFEDPACRDRYFAAVRAGGVPG
jgi:TolB-like protein/DNA-binding SARP family transcriptional activator